MGGAGFVNINQDFFSSSSIFRCALGDTRDMMKGTLGDKVVSALSPHLGAGLVIGLHPGPGLMAAEGRGTVFVAPLPRLASNSTQPAGTSRAAHSQPRISWQGPR